MAIAAWAQAGLTRSRRAVVWLSFRSPGSPGSGLASAHRCHSPGSPGSRGQVWSRGHGPGVRSCLLPPAGRRRHMRACRMGYPPSSSIRQRARKGLVAGADASRHEAVDSTVDLRHLWHVGHAAAGPGRQIHWLPSGTARTRRRLHAADHLRQLCKQRRDVETELRFDRYH